MDSDRGVISLVGIGGAGKTATLEQFLARLLDDNDLDGILVWSFYDDPDTNAFLKTAVEYVTGELPSGASGTGWFHSLRQILDSGARYLFVLDGLERVQRAHTTSQGIYGELEDPLLRGLLRRLVSAGCQSKAIVTSRFPISDLDSWHGRGHEIIDIDHLDEPTALAVLGQRGVMGEPAALTALLRRFGRHALTVDLLGTATKLFFDGQADRLPTWNPPPGEDPNDPSVRLSIVLTLFHDRMAPETLDLMCRICVFRFGVTIESLGDVFLGEGPASGVLAGANRERLLEWLDWLRQTHLVHLELDGKYTVHPAVRDHFYRLFRDASSIHGAISEHLLSLSERPGVGLPTAKEALDLLEELIYHALRADREDDAVDIYLYRMGGHEHLNATLGEYARTYRILGSFPTFSDAGAMYSCLRAFGLIDEALTWRPRNRYLLIANGRLEELREDPSQNTRRAARFLLGESHQVPERLADFPLPAAHLHLLADDLVEAEISAQHEARVALFQDDVVRSQLALGEVARRKGDYDRARECFEEAGQWVLRSGSHEHLCLLFLYRGRLEADLGELPHARTTLLEAKQIATESSFHLIGVEIDAETSRVLLSSGEPELALAVAERAAAEALRIRFPWGEALACLRMVEAATATGDSAIAERSNERLQEIRRSLTDAKERGRPPSINLYRT
ncbi:tetratricopeptide repeat protein [bacterium]|nr:MAG: tetratricopeptide repeat protein [bacterium]